MIVTASIVLYKNERKKLQEAINSFLNSKMDFKSILYLVDNSPTDDLKDIVEHSNVVYIFNPSNPGFGAAHNIAIKKAMNENSKYHLVLNPDVYFNEDVIREIINYMETDVSIANVMPKVYYPDGNIQYLCKLLPTPYDWIGRRFNPFKKMVEKRNQLFELRFTNYDKTMDVPYLSGCFMFLRLEAVKKTGLFDEKIFMYGEETDLCRRLIANGFRTVFYPNVSIYHHFEKGSHKSWRLTKIGIQSAIYYFNKWGWFFDKERKKINNQTLQKLRK
ncbi:glycosyltransferase family 2 protein [Riemerella anatipestifer]|uniref:glycosyltransferase family 2 protein n=1 Tax=Riemerella anatipestifer TaxID=34085 RepID=UPI00129E2349|nr:glycosyltransferase family 2 protein [Riemerella anatipestifer]MRM83757.1 glycosyltransferase family 2 protein [Riemerella anatipestifer]